MKSTRAQVSKWVLGIGAAAALMFMLMQLGQAQSTEPVILRSYTVKIEVENQLARVVIEQIYFNTTKRVREEVYIFPVPEGTVVSGLTLCSEGKCHEGKLLEANQARRIYDEIVGRRQDPALLEYVDERTYRVSVFPIPPRGEQKVKISYQQILKRRNNLIELLYPLTAQKAIGQLTIQVAIHDNEPILDIHSPTHKAAIEKISDHKVKASFEGTNIQSDQDFALYYTLTPKESGVEFFTYKLKDEDGYFVLLINPTRLETREALPKDIVFVFDVSGSMEGEKLQQTKTALKYALGKLGPDDRFGLVAFSDLVRTYRKQLLFVREAELKEVEQFIDRLSAEGSTDLNAALMRGLDLFEENGRVKILVFLTDGQPGIGETDPNKILQSVKAKNEKLGVRIFAFGVGYDVNVDFLEQLSLENGGFSIYIKPSESVEGVISEFFEKVGFPILTNLELDFGHLDEFIYDVYPRKLPDLFKGGQLQIVGHYSAHGKTKVTLRAKRGEEPVQLEFELNFPKESTEQCLIGRLWASRKIAYLLAQNRLRWWDQEIINSITKLAGEFGIVTPYTSYFAAPEDIEKAWNIEQFIIGRKQLYLSETGANTGIFRVRDEIPLGMEITEQAIRESLVIRPNSERILVRLPEAMSDWEYAPSESTLPHVKQANGRIFVLREGIWNASNYAGQQTLKVKLGSEAYDHLAKKPKVKNYLALGPRVIFPWVAGSQAQFIEVAENEGATTIAELQQAQVEATTEPESEPKSANQTEEPESNSSSGGLINLSMIISAAILLGVVALLLSRR